MLDKNILSEILLVRLRRSVLSIVFTGATFVVPLPVIAASSQQCESIFTSAISERRNPAPLLKMDDRYRGEEVGTYIDPVTKVPWKVKYFNENEQAPFELIHENGVFITYEGKKADSPFDAEALSFESSLIVIDRNQRVLVLPFEERGKYHHSSLSRGEAVLFAGTAAFANGKLRELTSNSGHYKPSTEQTLKVLKWLHSEGVDLSQVKLAGRLALDISGTYSMTYQELLKLRPDLL